LLEQSLSFYQHNKHQLVWQACDLGLGLHTSTKKNKNPSKSSSTELMALL